MFEDTTKRFIREHQLIEKGDRIVVAVSGGPDSLALLHFLDENKVELGVDVEAAHLDHMFRGEESFQELLFVREFCNRRHIPFHGERVDVSTEIERTNGSLQDKARQIRYGFLKEVMEEVSATKLALGHHGDDQVETILMKLTRGASGAGRAGIPVKRPFAGGEIIRPLLSVTKEEIERYCETHGLIPRRDPSNEKEDYTRNRFRKRILPFLKQENPHVHLQFQRFSEELTEDEAYLEELTREKLNKVWNNTGDYSTLHIDGFLAMAQPLQRRGINLILNYLYKLRPSSLSSIHIYDVLGILKGKTPNASLDLPKGLKVTRAYHTCYFHFGDLALTEVPYCYELQVNNRLDIQGGYQFLLYSSPPVLDRAGDVIYLDPSTVSLPLYVRTRRSKDRMKVKGMEGSKKLKALFIDQKIPAHLRDEWPIVVDAENHILWVPGMKKSIYDLGEEQENSLVLQFTSNHLLGGS
ncbi:tRNA lysidine(34) synthetase TilS [Rossellomorea sp. YZS02]|uniref:tRNA lysidine(34) synthetase TilS n=1 Tax=Rossellomorea sp. YZS02 TaxID=3097358 RepID=UPI002A1760BB|nr:tRNA lysidine(34) synthetase TilS [Rossellomorea sp. YZS02]MDX8345976.1 tRNA lysidine(34) synthetase TilS [Rossellomorea sp. YZS02]